uniref:Pyruvate kinase n=1 Tax=Noccaea caerulescens TaxID=107243 RepID=A0A1J3DDU0_NOCCA
MEKLVGGVTKNGASKTKIVWTLGPASRSVETIEKLLKAGMNVARFNFSHGSHAYHQETLDNLRTAMHKTGILCAVMLDTKGPEIRTGLLKEGKRDSNIISMGYKKLAKDLKPGDAISLTVLSCDEDLGLVRCRCENSGVVDLPKTLTQKDKEDILQWGIPNKIDIIALSSVRRGSDLDEVRKLLGVHRKRIMLMSKIENEEGYANVPEIVKKSDALMVVRGSLGMEMSTSKIDRAQRRMIWKAMKHAKPIVTAIQMPPTLESMSMTTPPPPDGDDVTNAAALASTSDPLVIPVEEELTKAVRNYTDCVMLSGVTADPETTVQTMSRICKEAENSIDYKALHQKIFPKGLPPYERMAASLVGSTIRLADAKAVVVVTKSGYKAEAVAKYRPSVPILSVVDLSFPESAARVACRGLVYRGIIPVVGAGHLYTVHDKTQFGIEFAKKEGICKVGDLVLALVMSGGPAPITIPLMVFDE